MWTVCYLSQALWDVNYSAQPHIPLFLVCRGMGCWTVTVCSVFHSKIQNESRQNPSKEKQVPHKWLKIGKKLCAGYERAAGSIELLGSAQRNDFPLVHSVTFHNFVEFWNFLRRPHYLIKTCRCIKGNIGCSIRGMSSGLLFFCGWYQFGV